MGAMDVIVEDLLFGQDSGWRTRDHSLPEDDPRAFFRMHCVLLFWCGDYKGQGKASGMTHQGCKFCHWCEIERHHDPVLNRMHMPSARSFLPHDHPMRSPGHFASSHLTPAPQPRTHQNVTVTARRLYGCPNPTQREELSKSTGVKEECRLSMLDHFDMVWDYLLDMMHCIGGFLEEHIIPVLKGQRPISAPKPPQAPDPDYPQWTDEEVSTRTQEYEYRKERHREEVAKLKQLELSSSQIAEADRRAQIADRVC